MMRAPIHIAVLLAAVSACGDPTTVDPDLGPIDETLSFADRVNWPGVDQGGGRVIPFIRGFGEGKPAAYWFLGFASRRTADSFWFCRDGAQNCPLDEHHQLNWDEIVGHPLFTRIPGQLEFSPFWQMWVVHVPDDYEADSVKTVASLNKLVDDDLATAEPLVLDFGDIFGTPVGPQMVVLHCALVLQGTTLAENGGMMPDESGPMKEMTVRQGWHEGYGVSFVDFSVSDGVFAEADDSENRPLMRFANIYINWRRCTGDASDPAICSIPAGSLTDRRPVSERGLGQDLTGDGDVNDTNNTIGAIPCKKPARDGEKVYSPAWGVNNVFTEATADISMIDTTSSQMMSDIQSSVDMFANIADGTQTGPVVSTEDESGNPVPGNDGQVFFNCPSPVPAGFVPYPCEDNP